MPSRTYLVLGGGGMIGFQIAHRICRHLDPKTVIIASLFQQEVREAATTLRKDFPEVNVVEFWGDVFVRSDLNAKDKENILRRSDLLLDDDRRAELFQDLFGNADSAYECSQLVQLIRGNKNRMSSSTPLILRLQSVIKISIQPVRLQNGTLHRFWMLQKTIIPMKRWMCFGR